MSVDLNLIRSKRVGAHPRGPASTFGGKRQLAGKVGMTRDKKGSAAHKAGIGHVGRRPDRFAVAPGAPKLGASTPRGPRPGASPSVRLPARLSNLPRPARIPNTPRPSALGSFFKRFRKGG